MTSLPAELPAHVYRDPCRPAATARLAAVGTALVAVSLPLVALLHVLPPSSRINPMTRTLSEYALGANGWLFDIAVLALAVGSAAVTAGLVRAGVLAPFSPATVLLTVWCVGLGTVVVFEKHNWAVGPSFGGVVHRIASLAAFLALPAGALLAARARWRNPGWRTPAAWTRATAWLSVAALCPLFYAVGVHLLTGRAWWRVLPLGAVERLLGLTEVVVVLVLGWWAVRAHSVSTAPTTPPTRKPAETTG